jgi:hypothetical protein
VSGMYVCMYLFTFYLTILPKFSMQSTKSSRFYAVQLPPLL